MSTRNLALAAYKEALASSHWLRIRDRIASAAGNISLRVASREYRRVVQEAISLGLTQMVSEGHPNPPFDEPLDDDAEWLHAMS